MNKSAMSSTCLAMALVAVSMVTLARDIQGPGNIPHPHAFDGRNLYVSGNCGKAADTQVQATALCEYDVVTGALKTVVGTPYPGIKVLRAVETTPTRLYIAETRLAYLQAGEWHEVRTFRGHAINALRQVGETLWVGTNKGLYAFSNGRIVESYDHRRGLNSNSVWSISRNGSLLFIGTYHNRISGNRPADTYGNGLNVLDLRTKKISTIHLPDSPAGGPSGSDWVVLSVYETPAAGLVELFLWHAWSGKLVQYDLTKGTFLPARAEYDAGQGWRRGQPGGYSPEVLGHIQKLEAGGLRLTEWWGG